MVLFGSLLDQFVSVWLVQMCVQNSNLMQIDLLTLSTKILINRFNGLETFILSLIYRNQRSRFRLELMVIFVSI